jgi:AbrB family looped-hinge helix DNA binding protein
MRLRFQWTSARFFIYNSQVEDKLVTIDNVGRILIPAAIRKTLSIFPGDRLVVRMENETLRLLTRAQAIALAQALVRPHVAEGRSLAEELLAERRRETAED